MPHLIESIDWEIRGAVIVPIDTIKNCKQDFNRFQPRSSNKKFGRSQLDEEGLGSCEIRGEETCDRIVMIEENFEEYVSLKWLFHYVERD